MAVKLFALTGVIIASGSAARLAATNYDPSDASLFLWSGRYISAANDVTFDVEGASVSFWVQNATFVGLTIKDQSAGGAKLGVWMDTQNASGALSDPNPSGRAMPFLRVATLLTSPEQSLYTLGSGAQISGLTVRYTVQLLTEWQLIGDGVGALLSVTGVSTNGVILPSPPRPARRLVILGDSLSSGVGCGFSRPPSGAACGDGVPIDDVSLTWGANLCSIFGAECEIVAASGITISADAGYNLPLVFPYALGTFASNKAWSPASKVMWDAAAHPADAVLMELGENDCHAYNCAPGSPDLQKLADSYVSFVQVVTTAYKNRELPVFLTLANHEAGQSAAMLMAIPTLTNQGYNVSLLNATTPNAVNGTSIDNGCAGHPSAAQCVLAAQRAAPVIAAALGW